MFIYIKYLLNSNILHFDTITEKKHSLDPGTYKHKMYTIIKLDTLANHTSMFLEVVIHPMYVLTPENSAFIA